MTPNVRRQVADVQSTYTGLVCREEPDGLVVLAGILAFEAVVPGGPTISDEFDVEFVIPVDYPTHLPTARELNGKLDRTYEHLYPDDKSFCLAVPVEVRRIFSEVPTLKGFIDRLVIPFLYGYCHWKQFGTYPFGERPHGSLGITQLYREQFSTDDDFVILAIIALLFEHGYRGHHACPCGSGKRVRQCHAKELRAPHESHSKETLCLDMDAAMKICAAVIEADESQKSRLTPTLAKQVHRILEGKKPVPGFIS